LKRRFTGRSLFSCRKSLTKERIILALDFSGSCHFNSRFFSTLARFAEKMGDVEVVDASNGFNSWNWSFTQKKQCPAEEMFGRKVVFFGDFDGGASLVELSKKADVYWL